MILKNALREREMDKPTFVYVTFINTTPEKLWAALTSGEFTKRYWYGRRVESDWRVGSPVTFWVDDGLDVSGEVLESDPPRRLSFTWRSLCDDEMRRERPSRVTFEIESAGSVVKLTLTHDDFEPDSKVYPAICSGWPRIVSSLKTLLETGRPLS
jgi:uncharacterized protein YndB with AHSA1/START domain